MARGQNRLGLILGDTAIETVLDIRHCRVNSRFGDEWSLALAV